MIVINYNSHYNSIINVLITGILGKLKIFSLSAMLYTLLGQKYFKNLKYTCTNCAINRLNIEFKHKIVINNYEY